MRQKLVNFLAAIAAVAALACAITIFAYLYPASGPYVVELENIPELFTQELVTEAAKKAMEARGYSHPRWQLVTALTPYARNSVTGGFPPWDPALHKAGFFVMGRSGAPHRVDELFMIDVKLEGKVITCLIRRNRPSK